jgi:hypothetical protein
MGQPNDFRYFLTLDNERTEIIFAPDGWDTDTIISYKRSADYFGVIRSMALPLQFVLDGAAILRRAFYKYGIEAGVRIEVEVLDKATWSYKSLFYGDIDFSKFEDNKDHVSVTLMESGMTRSLKAYEGVTYEYDLTGNDVVNLILPGIGIAEDATSIFLPSALSNKVGAIPGLNLVINNMDSGYGVPQNVAFTTTIPPDDSKAFFKAARDINIRIKGNVKGSYRCTQGTTRFTLELHREDDSFAGYLFDFSSGNTPGNDPIPFERSFDVNYFLPNGKYLFLLMFATKRAFDMGLSIDEGDFVVSYSTTSDPSNCKGIPAFSLFKRMMNKISPGTPVDSFLLKDRWKNLIFTSGDGIREIPTAKIKQSFKDFYATFLGIDDAAFGLENNVARLEGGSYFARPVQSVNLGAVKEFELKLADQYIFNSIKIGYDDGNTDSDDGKQEYNSGQEWATPITRIQKQQDWVSPTRADQYGIEKLRTEYIKKTSDTSSDNDTFMLDCVFDGVNYVPILGSSYDLVSGLAAPETSYNLNLTPKQNLLRHAGYLRSMLDKLDGNYINFGSGEKNTEVLTIKGPIRVKEKDNVPISSLPGKYFLPYVATITTKLQVNTVWLIDSMPFGYVSFTWNDVVVKGYILEISIDIARNTEREFKLLLTDDNDLSQLA